MTYKTAYMATVYKRGEKWWAQWYMPGGKRIARNTGLTKKRDAQRRADEMEAKERKVTREAGDLAAEFRLILDRAAVDAQDGKLDVARAEEHITSLLKLADPNFRVVSLETFLNEWCNDQSKHVGESTAGVYHAMKRNFTSALGPQICKAPVGELTRAQVKAAHAKITTRTVIRSLSPERTVKASSANLYLRHLRRALAEAVNQGLARVNVPAGVRMLAEDDSIERAPFEVSEIRAMMDHEKTSYEWRGMILIGGHSGLRLRDVAELGAEHLQGTEIVIVPRKTKRTKKVIRIPLTPPILTWLENRPEKGEHWFPLLRAKTKSTLSGEFKRIMARAGVPAKVTLPGGIVKSRSYHSLRYSFIKWLTDGDIHADVRRALAGHSSEKVHDGYTTHDETLHRAIKVLPDFHAESTGTDG